MRIVVTIVGKDRVGIIARASNVLAEHTLISLILTRILWMAFLTWYLLLIWKKPICSLIN